jgi:hypothetical protein
MKSAFKALPSTDVSHLITLVPDYHAHGPLHPGPMSAEDLVRWELLVREVCVLFTQNPFMSQREIARRLHVSRSTVRKRQSDMRTILTEWAQ